MNKGLLTRLWRGFPGGCCFYGLIDEWGCLGHRVSYIDRLTICMYILFLCMGAWIDTPVIATFLLKHDCPFGRTPVGVRIPWRIIPLQLPLPGTTRALNFFRKLNCLGHTSDQTVSSKNREAYNLGVHSILVTGFHLTQYFKMKHRPLRIIKSN